MATEEGSLIGWEDIKLDMIEGELAAKARDNPSSFPLPTGDAFDARFLVAAFVSSEGVISPPLISTSPALKLPGAANLALDGSYIMLV